MGLSLDGLASGLDSTTLINSLMQVEAIPQALLKNKASATQTMISALQELNTKVAGLATLSKDLSAPEAFQKFTATSSSESVAISVAEGATSSSLDIVVGQLATSQVTVTGPVTEWDTTDFTITSAGQNYAISAASTSLEDVITAVNASDSGVKAVKFDMGDGTYRLQFTAAGSGAENAFSLSGTSISGTQTSAAQDAEVTLWAGSAAEQVISSPTNTFANLLPGTEITVSKVSTEPVTLVIASDPEATAGQASSLVDKLNGLFEFITANSSVSVGTGGSTRGMIFTGDSLVRSVKQRITDAAIMPINGRSPSEIGISITRQGTLEFDDEKFTAALAGDPSAVQAILANITSRVHAVSDELSDQYDGGITSRIKGQESTVDRLQEQISDWDRRLDKREATLKRTYAALEVQLSNMNAQQSYLASQLASLPSTKEK